MFQTLCHMILSSSSEVFWNYYLHPLGMIFSLKTVIKKKKSVIWVPVELHWRCRKLTWPRVSLGCVIWQKLVFDQCFFSFLGNAEFLLSPALPCSWWVCVTLTLHQAHKNHIKCFFKYRETGLYKVHRYSLCECWVQWLCIPLVMVYILA